MEFFVNLLIAQFLYVYFKRKSERAAIFILPRCGEVLNPALDAPMRKSAKPLSVMTSTNYSYSSGGNHLQCSTAQYSTVR